MRAGAHVALDDLRHARDLGGRGDALEVVAQDGVADAAVADVHADVDGGGLLLERGEVGGERERRAAVLASYDGSDALRDDGEGVGALVEPAVGVGVRVDEARGEDEAAGVDDAVAAGAAGGRRRRLSGRPGRERTTRRPGEPVPSMTTAFVMRMPALRGRRGAASGGRPQATPVRQRGEYASS